MRVLIKSGDIVGIKSKNRFLLYGQRAAWFIYMLLKLKPPFDFKYTEYTHVGILIKSNINDQSFWQVAEMNGHFNGFRMLLQFKDKRQDVTVFECPVDRKTLCNIVTTDLERYCEYDNMDVVGVWFNSAIDAHHRDNDKQKVCSTWVLEKLVQAGYKPPKHLSKMPSPAHIASLFKEKAEL